MKLFLPALALCFIAGSTTAQTIRVTASGATLDHSREMRLAVDEEVVITITFARGQQPKDMLTTVEGKLCTAGSSSTRTKLFFFEKGVAKNYGGGLGKAQQNVFTYTFSPLKLSGCRDAGFYLVFTFRNTHKLFRFYVANERRADKQYQSQQQMKKY